MKRKSCVSIILINYTLVLFACLLYRVGAFIWPVFIVFQIILTIINYKAADKVSTLFVFNANLLISTLAAHLLSNKLYYYTISSDSDTKLLGLLGLIAGEVFVFLLSLISILLKTLGKKKTLICVLSVMICLAFISVGLFMKSYWTPGKYAVKEEDFDRYKPYIIVQEVHYTGTGWVQSGDENGYFPSEAYRDIALLNGDLLPLMYMYDEDYVNKFLCKVEYAGKTYHPAYADEIDSYYIVEWYPVYPVLRDTLLPSWMFPKGFMSNEEIGSKSPQNNGMSALYEHYQFPNEDFYGKTLYYEIDYECSAYERKVADVILNRARQVAEYTGTPQDVKAQLGDVGALNKYYYFDTENAVTQEVSFEFITCKITDNGGHLWVASTVSRYDESGEHVPGGGRDILCLWYITERKDGWHVVKALESP